jgi:tRNA dimethylallyltransferase
MGQQATRNYAKRQYTWLRHQPPPNGRECCPKMSQLRPPLKYYSDYVG